RDELASAALRVEQLENAQIQSAGRQGPVAVLLPPVREDIRGALSPRIAFLGFLDPLGRVLTTESQQRVADPAAPLLEAAERLAGLDVAREAPPAPDCEHGTEQINAPVPHFLPDVGREGARLRVLHPRIELDDKEPTGEVFREGEAVAG